MAYDNSLAAPTTGTTITSTWGGKVVQNIQATARRCVTIEIFGPTTDVATGDGKKYFGPIPAELNAHNLVSAVLSDVTAGITGTTDVQIANVTDAVDMLSTKLTIDSGETSSATAATPAVIDTTKDDLATGDMLRIDVDAKSTTPPKGLYLTMTFAPA